MPQNNQSKAALLQACSDGDLAKVIQAVDAGADINAQFPGNQHPLYITVINNHKPVVEYLLTKGANVNEKNSHNGLSALYKACYNGFLDIVKVLVNAGANVNIKSINGYSPLYPAVAQDHKPVVEYLLTKGANVNEKNGPEGSTALHNACFNGFLEIAKVLVDAGANVNIKSIIGHSPLYSAVAYNHKPVVEYLLTKGVNVNEKNGLDGSTALHIACYNGVSNIVKVLVNAGADQNAPNNQGKTPLDVAIKKNHQIIVEYLQSIQGSKSIWKGFTQYDIAKFDTIFEESQANNVAVCPICLKYVERSEACMYMNHNCATLGGYYHHELYAKYKNASDQIGWCTICGRICIGHNHYELEMANKPKAAVIATAHDPFSKDCRDSNGGGGLPEKFTRFQRMREIALQLQDFVGQMTEVEALNALVEETWNAPLHRSFKIPKIMAEKKWNIATFEFPPNVAPLTVLVANVNDPTAYQVPNVLVPGNNNYVGNTYSGDSESPVVIFTHKSASGVNHIHPAIGKEMLLDVLDAAGEKQGKCFDDTCGGLLWPKEIQLAFENPKMSFTITDEDRERLRKYKERFNNWHTSTVGGAKARRKTRRRNR